MNESKQGVTNLIIQASVTFVGDGEPLTALRVLADGKPAALPLSIVVLGSDEPVVLAAGIRDPQARAGLARALVNIGSDMALSLLPQPEQEAPQQNASAEAPASLDTVNDQ